LIRAKVAEAHETQTREFDDERSHHQKMMSDYTRLQQRLENLQGDMQLMTSTSLHRDDDRCQLADSADSVISEMSDAGGDNVSLDGSQTVCHIAFYLLLCCNKVFITQAIKKFDLALC